MAGTFRRALDGTRMYTCPNVECAMGKKEKAKKKSQSDASNDLFKRVEEIYGTLFSIYNWLIVVCMYRNQIRNLQCLVVRWFAV